MKQYVQDFPSVVWQQQMVTAKVERKNKNHLIRKDTPKHHTTIKQNISTPVQPLPQIPDYEPQLIDPHYELNLYWNDDMYDQDKLEYKHNFSKTPEQIGDDDIITD